MFTIRQSEQLVIIQHTCKKKKQIVASENWKILPVQVLHPFWINVTIENDPMEFRALSTNIVYYLPQNMCEQTIIPLTGGRIKCTIEGILMHCLGIDDVFDTFNALKSFQRLE